MMPTTSKSPSPTAEFYPTPATLRCTKHRTVAVIGFSAMLLVVAVGLTLNPVLIGMGVLGLMVSALVVRHELGVARRADDPAWMAANVPRVGLTAMELCVTLGDTPPQRLLWAEVDDAWQARATIVVRRRDGSGALRIPSHYFSFQERRALLAELHQRIAASGTHTP